MIKAPHMLLLGSESKNAGRTVFACAVIERFARRHTIVAVKVTPEEHQGYTISEETEPGTEKDTQRLLQAGATRAYWLRTSPESLGEGIARLLSKIDKGALIVAESSRLRTAVAPAVFLMLRRRREEATKPSAAALRRQADRVVEFDGSAFDLAPDDLAVVVGRWALFAEARRRESARE